MADLIYYKSDDVTGQSQGVMAVARKKYPSATIVDNAGDDESAIDSIIAALVDDTYENIVLCSPICDTHVAGRWLGTQACDLVPKLVTANQTSGVSNPAGTSDTNANVLKIKLASGDTGEDDDYNQMLIETVGTTAVARLITDFDKTSKLVTVATTTTAIDGETYIIFNTPYLRLLGETHSTYLPVFLAWNNLYPSDDQVPLVVAYLGGLNNLYEKNNKTATDKAAGSITDTGEFTLNEYTDEEKYVAIISSSVSREAGQIRKIASNTADVLTLEEDWYTTPTGTLTYQVVDRGVRALWDTYLKYAVAVYGSENSNLGAALWKDLITDQDMEVIYDFVEKGKVIADSVYTGILS